MYPHTSNQNSTEWSGFYFEQRSMTLSSYPFPCPTSPNYAGYDIGLVYLNESELAPHSFRPSFNANAGPANSSTRTVANVGMAGYSAVGNETTAGLATWRKSGFYPSISLARVTGEGGVFWLHSYGVGDTQARGGDSGGPLYRVLPDGRRDIIGVSHSGTADKADPTPDTGDQYWADITAPANRDWIIANALDSSVDGGHTAAWLAQHGKGADFWFGEVDYVGECKLDVDRDCDGWYDRQRPPGQAQVVLHDNCPVTFNADQRDSNDDGIGDACAKCWWDPNNDQDGDGICGDGPNRPGYEVIDNCPTISNKDQANCNEAAERKQSAAILGDVCDPVPCPRVAQLDGFEISSSGKPYNPTVGGTIISNVQRNAFRPFAAPPYRTTAPMFWQDHSEIPTTARFCQSNPGAGYDCHLAVGDSYLYLAPNAESEPLSPAQPWHRIRASHATSPARGATWTSWNYTRQNQYLGQDHFTWGYKLDWSDWVPSPSTAIIPPAMDGSRCFESECLQGTMWFHAFTGLGDTQTSGIGYHGPQLANHYLDVSPSERNINSLKGHGIYKKLWWWQKLFRVLATDSVYRPHGRPLGLSSAGVVHMLHDNGGGEELDAVTTEALRNYLSYAQSDSIVVAANVEPDVSPKAIHSDIEAAFVSYDGTTIWDVAIAQPDGKLGLGYEVGFGFQGNAAVVGGAPPARHGFLSIFSPALGGVIVAGGLDNTTNEELNTVHLFRNVVGWSAFDGSFETIRAVSYSPLYRKIFIVTAAGTTAKIHSIDPWSGEVLTHGTYSWVPANVPGDSIFLSVDKTGSLLLTTSRNDGTSTTAGVVLDPPPINNGPRALSITHMVTIAASQHMAPSATGTEYSFVLDDGAGKTTSILRLSELPSAASPVGGLFH